MSRFIAQTVFTTIIFVSFAGTVNGDFVITITDNGGGQTRMQFSGSTDIAAGSPTSTRNGFWFEEDNLGGFDIDVFFGALDPVSGNWTGTSTPVGNLTLDDFFLDDFRFGVRTNPDPAFGAGDTISWDGDFVIDVPFTNFSPGTFVGNNIIGTVGDFQTTTTPITINVGIPEPTTAGLIGLTVAGLAFARRRK